MSTGSHVAGEDRVAQLTHQCCCRPELFALHLGLHFTSRYDHISKAHVKVTSLKWTRIEVRSLA